MSNLPQKTLETIKSLLMRQQKQVEQNLKTVKADDPAMAPALAESSEPGTDSWIAENHTSTLALGDSLKRTAGHIKNALGRIKDGTYGKCKNCGNPIEHGRIFAMPTAELCLTCSKKTSK
ncbi:MAG: TraR/DksA C4-type zinc finger protein [Candidatus Daviesbacteria bacterium]|nr:TraR/DksA C4-type zinc finger protein [Candidatus Daviesbacteria bacterium]